MVFYYLSAITVGLIYFIGLAYQNTTMGVFGGIGIGLLFYLAVTKRESE